MNKGQLVDVIAEEAGLSKKDAEKAVNAFVAGVTKSLVAGDPVQLIGFGTFKTSERKARKGHNPKEPGEIIQIPAKTVAQFKAGKALAEAVNCKKCKANKKK